MENLDHDPELETFLPMTTSSKFPASRSKKVFKACETCRKRKVKCDGMLPCASCTKRLAPCYFRASARRQAISPERNAVTSHCDPNLMQTDAVSCSVHSTASLLSERLRVKTYLHYVLQVTRIDDGYSGRGRIARLFGSTSTVTLLNLALHLLTQSDSLGPSDWTVESIRMHHNPQAVLEYFRHVILRQEALSPPPANLSCPTALHSVSLQLQSQFLERYIETSWKILPFQPPNSLRGCLQRLSSQPTSQIYDQDKALSSIMLPLLAIGSITTGQAELGELFIGEARRNVSNPYLMGDLLVIQSDLLQICLLPPPLFGHTEGNANNIHIQYYIDSGSFELAWVGLGTTIAKMIAVGMDSRTPSAQEQAIITAFCCSERHLPTPLFCP